MTISGAQLLEEAHRAYLKRDEWQRKGYELEQQAHAELRREARAKELTMQMAKEKETR